MALNTASRSLMARLDRLEQSATNGGTGARQILVANGGPLSDEELHAFLATQGVVVGKDDMVVRMITVYETRPGEPRKLLGPPSLLSIHPLGRLL